MIKLPPLGRPVLPSLKDLTKPVLPKTTSTFAELRPLDLPQTLLPVVASLPVTSLQWSTNPSLIPVSKSVYDKLRPSLIELHFPHGNSGVKSLPNSLSGKHSGLTDSIGSHSLSIFSGPSSILSTSSGRASSFGSVSHIVFAEKRKSIGPLEQYPVSPQIRSSVPTIKEEKVSASNAAIGGTDIAAEVFKPSTPLYKSKVEFLLDTPEPREENVAKRQKTEPFQSP